MDWSQQAIFIYGLPNTMQPIEYQRRACRACLATDCVLHELKDNGLAEKFEQVTSLRVQKFDFKLQHICSFCRALLMKAYRFRSRCLEIDKIMSYNFTAGMNYIHNIDTTNIMQLLTTTNILVDDCGGEKDIDRSALSLYSNDATAMEDDVALKAEPAEIEHLQSIDGYVINEPDKTLDNTYNNTDISKDENHKLNIQIHACRDVNKLVETQCNIMDELFEISPKNELEENFLLPNEPQEVFDMHESFNEETIDYTQVQYLEETDEDVNEPNSETRISNASNSKETTLSKSNTTKQRRRAVSARYTLTLTTLQDKLRGMESKQKRRKNVNKIFFYRHILDKYHMKTNRNVDKHHWNVDNLVPDNVEEMELEKQHEIANSSSNYSREIFHSFLKLKYRRADDDIIRSLQNCGKLKRSLYDHTDFNSAAAREYEQKYQIKIKCFASKEEKISLFESQKLKHAYLFRKYKCDICYVSYQDEDLYTRHMVLHDPSSGAHECEICHRYYSTRYRLRKHIDSHKFQYICLVPGCGRTFIAVNPAKNHHEFHKGERYPCQFCDKVFLKYSTRIQHNRIHHGTVACPLCYRRVSGSGFAMSLHRKNKHPEVFPCARCGTEFASRPALDTHEAAALCGGPGEKEGSGAGEKEGAGPGEKKGAGLGLKEGVGPDVKEGARVKEGAGPGEAKRVAACGACGETYASPDDLIRHIETHTGGKKRKKLKKRPARSIRPSVRDTVKNNANRAKKRPARKVTNSRHRGGKHDYRMHLMCEICSKMFRSKCYLREHMLIHTGEMPHGCRDCSQRFRTKAQLQYHVTSHSDPRPHHCKQCSKGFKTLHNLQRHQRAVHEGKRPFGCDICAKTYQTKHDVQMHVKTAHMNEPWPQRVRIGQRKSKE